MSNTTIWYGHEFPWLWEGSPELGIRMRRDGSLQFISAEGECVDLPITPETWTTFRKAVNELYREWKAVNG